MRGTDFYWGLLVAAVREAAAEGFEEVLCPLAGAGAVMCMLLLDILVPGCKSAHPLKLKQIGCNRVLSLKLEHVEMQHVEMLFLKLKCSCTRAWM